MAVVSDRDEVRYLAWRGDVFVSASLVLIAIASGGLQGCSNHAEVDALFREAEARELAQEFWKIPEDEQERCDAHLNSQYDSETFNVGRLKLLLEHLRGYAPTIHASISEKDLEKASKAMACTVPVAIASHQQEWLRSREHLKDPEGVIANYTSRSTEVNKTLWRESRLYLYWRVIEAPKDHSRGLRLASERCKHVLNERMCNVSKTPEWMEELYAYVLMLPSLHSELLREASREGCARVLILRCAPDAQNMVQSSRSMSSAVSARFPSVSTYQRKSMSSTASAADRKLSQNSVPALLEVSPATKPKVHGRRYPRRLRASKAQQIVVDAGGDYINDTSAEQLDENLLDGEHEA
eukprot:TRINITY_DN49152_c0_g1_i1.p1 TRINITY_DN49152_c0_g1~~TRINITY_DN49152_c0_g1_i1.p1  ORF type:complete len:372 (+),score=41.77 TRINITY_DN49152_c0_g1_i1:59-1117(+)